MRQFLSCKHCVQNILLFNQIQFRSAFVWPPLFAAIIFRRSPRERSPGRQNQFHTLLYGSIWSGSNVTGLIEVSLESCFGGGNQGRNGLENQLPAGLPVRTRSPFISSHPAHYIVVKFICHLLAKMASPGSALAWPHLTLMTKRSRAYC